MDIRVKEVDIYGDVKLNLFQNQLNKLYSRHGFKYKHKQKIKTEKKNEIDLVEIIIIKTIKQENGENS